MRESENFRPILERLDEKAPGKELLNQTEVGKILGIYRCTAAKRYPFRDGYISKVALARAMAKESQT